MDTTLILATIDDALHRLRQARALLSVDVPTPTAKKNSAPKAPSQRVMSADARARIAAAQKKRWAASKKAAK